MKHCVIGFDCGADSARAVVVDALNDRADVYARACRRYLSLAGYMDGAVPHPGCG